MRRFKANRPCAVSAGAEAAAMVDSANLKIERLLVRNELFRVRNAYFFAFMYSYSSKEHVELEGKTIKFRNLPTFLFSKIGRKVSNTSCPVNLRVSGFRLQRYLTLFSHLPGPFEWNRSTFWR